MDPKVNNYQKYKNYFQNYQVAHRPQRKFPYCLVCGQPNQAKKLKQRFMKTCSLACSLTWKRIYHSNKKTKPDA